MLISCLPITSILPSFFHSVIFLHKMWTAKLAFLLVLMRIYFLLRFEFWVLWSINHSMSNLIKKSVIVQLWYFLYRRMELLLFICHSQIQRFNTHILGDDCQVSVEGRLRTGCSEICMLFEARNFLLSQNIWTFSTDHPTPCSMGNGAPYLSVKR